MDRGARFGPECCPLDGARKPNRFNLQKPFRRPILFFSRETRRNLGPGSWDSGKNRFVDVDSGKIPAKTVMSRASQKNSPNPGTLGPGTWVAPRARGARKRNSLIDANDDDELPLEPRAPAGSSSAHPNADADEVETAPQGLNETNDWPDRTLPSDGGAAEEADARILVAHASTQLRKATAEERFVKLNAYNEDPQAAFPVRPRSLSYCKLHDPNDSQYIYSTVKWT